MAEFRALVVKGPDPEKDEMVRWRCIDLLAEVKRRFSVEVHESTIGAWLGELSLNSVEKVWDYLRKNKLCARVWDTYDDILEARRDAWNLADRRSRPHPINRFARLGMCQHLGGLV